MTTVMPKGDALRQAVKWISEMRQSKNPASERKLIEEACLKFNLTPKDADYLARFLRGEVE
ncbi:MAG TPA: hypothetical protein ENF48_11230 [Desulfobacteraceae bacterium]|nr:hypothetical protein [Deltaproteobacteria bacterium]RLB97864.1 MAG: hypothetical protein DRH76_03940 [Deltaproteobacteria bacterium]HDI60904.1 hypothetical protein [Desulfobacteraceae bacterium]